MIDSTKVLIVGGGIAGLTAAIALRDLGADVDVVEINPRVQGAGVGLSANALLVLRSLGVIDSVLAMSVPNPTGHICDKSGQTLSNLERKIDPALNLPSNVVIARKDLAVVLGRHATARGAHITQHQTVSALDNVPSGVDVVFKDGRAARYDLVIGADGLISTVRRLVFGDIVLPDYAGQCGWRWVTRRHPDVPTGRLLLAGQGLKVGLYPVAGDWMYAFTTEAKPELVLNPVEATRDVVNHQLAAFNAPYIADVRRALPESSEIHYSPFSTLLVPEPWHRGRILLIGDAAHTVTPHSSSGAALAIEDAKVLSMMLDQTGDIDHALEAFTDRRFKRVERVLNTSRAACLAENAGRFGMTADEQTAFWDFLMEPI